MSTPSKKFLLIYKTVIGSVVVLRFPHCRQSRYRTVMTPDRRIESTLLAAEPHLQTRRFSFAP